MSIRMRFIFPSALLVLALSSAAAAQEGPPIEGSVTGQPDEPTTEPVQARGAPVPFDLPQIPPGPTITLAQAIEMADQRNLTLEATRTEIERADAELYKSWASLFPNASAGMTYSHMDHADTASLGGNSITTRRQDTLTANVEVGVPIVNPMSWAGISAARVGLDIASISVESARQSLLLMVAQSYYQALTVMSQVRVLEQQIQAAAHHYGVARARLASGVGQRLDVLRAKGDLVRLEENLIAAHSALAASRDSLAILTGSEDSPLPTDIPEATPPSGDDSDLANEATRNREDIRLKRAMIELSEKQLTLAWMQFLPTLNGSWQLAHQFTEAGAMGDADKTRWTAYLMLSVPIYSQTRYADLDIKRAERRKAQLEEEDARRNAALEVRSARRDYDTAVQKIATAAEQAELASESLALTENEYILGMGTSLAVTDARRTSIEAEINLATRRLEAQLTLLKLMRAVGTDIAALDGAR